MININGDYQKIISGLKEKIRRARLKAAVLANTEMLHVYWEVGNTILKQQKEKGWGSKIIERLSFDLKTEFPDLKGFSVRNLKYMRAFAEAWPGFLIVQQSAAQLEMTENQIDTIVLHGVHNCHGHIT